MIFFLCSRESKMSKLFEIRVVMAKKNFSASAWPDLILMSNRIGAEIDCCGFRCPAKCYELLQIACGVQLDDKLKVKQSSNGIPSQKSCLLSRSYRFFRKFKDFSVLDSRHWLVVRRNFITIIPNSTDMCTFNKVGGSIVFLALMFALELLMAQQYSVTW